MTFLVKELPWRRGQNPCNAMWRDVGISAALDVPLPNPCQRKDISKTSGPLNVLTFCYSPGKLTNIIIHVWGKCIQCTKCTSTCKLFLGFCGSVIWKQLLKQCVPRFSFHEYFLWLVICLQNTSGWLLVGEGTFPINNFFVFSYIYILNKWDKIDIHRLCRSNRMTSGKYRFLINQRVWYGPTLFIKMWPVEITISEGTVWHKTNRSGGFKTR